MTKIVTNLFSEDKKKNFWIGFAIIVFLIAITVFALLSDRNFYRNTYPKLNGYEKDKYDAAQQDDQKIPESNPYFN